jgi:HTH-type transcriptional regulator/antitoxin HigA
MPPGLLIDRELRARGWTEHDLASVMGRPVAFVRELLDGRIEITLDLAQALALAVGMSPQTWMALERSYRGEIGAAS